MDVLFCPIIIIWKCPSSSLFKPVNYFSQNLLVLELCRYLQIASTVRYNYDIVFHDF